MPKQSGDARTRELMQSSQMELWAAFRRGGQFHHMGDRGDVREERLLRFLMDQLPGRYSATTGEIIDAAGQQSGQLDIVIYDNMHTRPLTSAGNVSILPAEAALATIEVKSRLSKQEVGKVVAGVKKVRMLRPFDAPWAVARRGGQHADDRMPRLFATLFAYGSDLSEATWAGTELSRFREEASAAKVSVQYVDRLVVLDRGMLLPSDGSGYVPASQIDVLGIWFFQLSSFLAREVARREPFPWDRYKWHERASWRQVGDPLFDAPGASRATASQRLKAKRHRKREG